MSQHPDDFEPAGEIPPRGAPLTRRIPGAPPDLFAIFADKVEADLKELTEGNMR